MISQKSQDLHFSFDSSRPWFHPKLFLRFSVPGVFLWGKEHGNSIFDRLYRIFCMHIPRLLKKAANAALSLRCMVELFQLFWETRHMSLNINRHDLNRPLIVSSRVVPSSGKCEWCFLWVAPGPGKMLRKTSSCMFGCGMGLRLLHQQPWQHFSRLGKWRGGTVDSPQKGLILPLRLKGYLVMKRGQSTFIW